MKKILLTTLYPFWFFFAKTWFGNVIMIPIALALIPILIYLIFNDSLIESPEYVQSTGIGATILTLLSSPFSIVFFMCISGKLESNYHRWNYKTEIKTKMF